MIEAAERLDSGEVGAPLPLDDVARVLGISRRTLERLMKDMRLTRYRVPGQGKRLYLDPDEVRRKMRPTPIRKRRS